MNRISKLLIVCWTAAVLLIECWYVSGSWYSAFLFGTVLFLGCSVAAGFDRRIAAPVLAIAYLTPILVFEAIGRYHVTYSVVWLAAVAGVVMPDALRTRWHLPRQWVVPLVCWVGGVCVTAPIIALRTVDFHRELLFRGRLPFEALGTGVPLQTLEWVLHVALLLSIGLLWFDWVCGQDESFVMRWVALPLGISVCVVALVCAYQLFVDVRFLNFTVYASLARASGTLQDGNVAGALAAYWIGGWTIFGLAARRRILRLIALGLAVLMWLPVWATGSRTAFATAVIVSVFSLMAAMRDLRRPKAALRLAAVAVLVLAAALAVATRSSAGVIGPINRIMAMLPSRDAKGIEAVVTELWDRNGYGVAATKTIAAYPWFGVGVGSFHEMASDFIPGGIPPDNAQNWYRHQLAELGVVGSLGWVVFLASFGWWVVRRRSGERPEVKPARGILVALGLVSLVGMAGQDPFVAITASTFAAWFLLVKGQPPEGAEAGVGAWAIGVVVLLVFAAGTAVMAATTLRVPTRMQRLGQDYLYGFYWPEPDGEGGEYRWARRRATAVIPAPTRSLELTLRVNHADLAAHPTRAKAWVDGKLVWEGTLTLGADSITKAVLLPDGQPRALIDTWADRAVTAPAPDGRELALMVRWRTLPSSR